MANEASVDRTCGALIMRKVQTRLLPFLFTIYVISLIDRINIGFAALTMNKELALTSQQFGVVAGIFFFGYIPFEVPSNLLLHKLGARTRIARILITWGTIAALTGFVRSVEQLYAARFLLGVAEAGYFPGIILYLTYWFRRHEQAQAIALFMSGVPVASILGAPMSGLILDHVHLLGISSWRWLLILEGFPAVILGLVTYFFLPSNPTEATFLTPDEKNWILRELRQEEQQKPDSRHLSAIATFANGRVWHLAFTAFTLNIGIYTMAFWLFQLVKSIAVGRRYSFVALLVTIPNLLGLAGMIVVSRSSDRRLERKYHAVIPAIVAGTAFLLLRGTPSALPRLALLCLVALGMYSLLGPFWALPGEFLAGISAASGIALINSVNNISGFVGPYLFGLITQRTGDLYAGLMCAGVSLFICATLLLVLPRTSGRIGESV